MKYGLLLCSLLLAGCTKTTLPVISVTPIPTTTSEFTTPAPTFSTSVSSSESLSSAVTSQIAQKYNQPTKNVSIKTTNQSGLYAIGTTAIIGQTETHHWYASKEKGGWLVDFEGQETITCDLANQYTFPQSMVPQCINQVTHKLIKR